jgi:hypothetical protein
MALGRSRDGVISSKIVLGVPVDRQTVERRPGERRTRPAKPAQVGRDHAGARLRASPAAAATDRR